LPTGSHQARTRATAEALAGNYALNPHNSVDVALDSGTIAPTALLRRLDAEYGIERIYWLRLQARGPHLWYIVKPTPSALAMVFDARTGNRLDPLSDELLATVANEALVGARFAGLEDGPEYNRYYDVSRVPAVRARVEGDQPATLVLSRDEGRTLRRLNAESGRSPCRMDNVPPYLRDRRDRAVGLRLPALLVASQQGPGTWQRHAI
jgi:hypothetical protein